MRKGTGEGPCTVCGKNTPGLYWHPAAIVVNLDIPGVAPMEPSRAELLEPVRCDDCEHKVAR
jgi:hypothetical protein